MKFLKLMSLKTISAVAFLFAAANVGVYSSLFFYETPIPQELKK